MPNHAETALKHTPHNHLLPTSLVVIALLLILTACLITSPKPPSTTPTSTPTQILSANGFAPSSIPQKTAAPSATPPDNFTLQGTYEAVSDILNASGGEGSVHTQSHMTVQFTLKSAPGNHLTGTAQASYTESYTFAGPGCKTSYNAGPLTWTSTLEGTDEKQADGSMKIGFLAKPAMGPAYSADKICLGSLSLTPDWPGGGGLLVNGSSDTRQDMKPTGPGATGVDYWTEHIELAPQN